MPAYFLLRNDPAAGIDIPAADWDNLVILDGCRYDLFESVNTIEGELSKVQSKAPTTGTFYARNFGEEQYRDTVYITANPVINLMLPSDEVFHDVINVWEDGWDDQLQTVLPETMVEATIAAYEQYPNKRLISHFVQPHYPFIGEKAQNVLSAQRGFKRGREDLLTGQGTVEHESVWEQCRNGEISRDLVWELYEENLELALSSVQEILDVVKDRTVVTSDHGNMLGEYAKPFPVRIWGHPRLMTDELVTVPWLEIDSDTRKRTTAESPKSDREFVPSKEHDEVKQRLRDLGYT